MRTTRTLEFRKGERTWTIRLHPVPFSLDSLDLATVPVPLPVTLTFTIAAVPISLSFSLPLPLACIVWVDVPSSPSTGAGTNTKSDRASVRCQAQGTERLTTRTGRGAAGHGNWGTTKAK